MNSSNPSTRRGDRGNALFPAPASRLAASALGAAALLLLGLHSAQAQTVFTYSGQTPGSTTTPTSGNFTLGFNGDGSTPATYMTPVSGNTNSLVFNGTAYTATDDLTAGLTVNSLTFGNTGAVIIARGGTGTSNTINLAGTNPTINLGNTGSVSLNLSLGLSALNTSILGTGTATFGQGITLSSGGSLNFGTGSDAPAVTSGSNIGYSGNFNMKSGTLSITNGSQFFDSTGNTLTQTGGTISTNGLIEFANGGGVSTVNISGGSLTTSNANATDATDLAVRGTTTVKLSGGTITTPVLNMTTSQLSGGAAGSTFNLNGGTLITGTIIPGTNGTHGSGTIFNFNGGTLQSSKSTATFMQGLTNAFVLSGGALINTSTFNDTIGQNLLTGTANDGGLTKSGTGTLTLSGANTYNGATAVTAGTLQLGAAGALGNGTSNTSGVAVTSGATLDLAGITPTASVGLALNGTGVGGNGALINSSATAATYSGLASLGSSSSIVSNSGDIILSNPGTISVANTGATDVLTLGGTDVGGSALQSTLSDAGSGGFGLNINKVGAGTWTLSGGGTSTLGKGKIVETAGTFNFATSAADTTSLALNGQSSGGNVGVYVDGGTFNMNGGTLTTSRTGQGLVIQGTGTVYNQTGGLLNTTNNDFIEISNGGSTTANISGGQLETGSKIEMAVAGTSTLNLSGSGLVTTPTLIMTTNQTTNTVSSIFNLGTGTVGGGTLATGSIVRGSDTNGSTTFNFNGGTLQSSASTTTFMQGLTNAFVKSGGAVINTNGFNDTIGQSLLTDTVSTGGSLTKQGTGTLTLSGANTYTGGTTITGGTLALSHSAADGTGALSIGTGTVVQTTVNNALGGGNVTITAATIQNTDLTANDPTPTVSHPNVSNDKQTSGTLTLGNGVNILDFGAGNTGAIFDFAASNLATWTGTLSVYDYTGLYPTSYNPATQVGTTGGGGLDQLFFGSSSTGLTQAQLNDITFYSGAGTGKYAGPAIILADGEVTAAPEPSEWAGLGFTALGLGGLLLRARKRRVTETAAA